MLTLRFANSEDPSDGPRLARISARRPPEFELALFLRDVEESDWRFPKQEPACQWPGVSCNINGTVTALSWEGRMLRGYLHWSQLPQTIEDVDLSSNQLFGNVFFDELPRHLCALRLQFNRFSGSLDLHDCPPNLMFLHLMRNDFTGPILFAKLPRGLRQLSLSENPKLTGTLVTNDLPRGIHCLIISGTKIERL